MTSGSKTAWILFIIMFVIVGVVTYVGWTKVQSIEKFLAGGPVTSAQVGTPADSSRIKPLGFYLDSLRHRVNVMDIYMQAAGLVPHPDFHIPPPPPPPDW